MTKASPNGHIIRQTCAVLLGVVLTFLLSHTPLGSATSGTLLIYCGLVELYTETSVQASGLLKKRLILQFMSVLTVTTINGVLYLIPAFRPVRWVRIFLAAAVCVPVLLSINNKKRLGLSEIGLLVPVALISMTFDNTPKFFLTRLLYTTVGICVSYLLFAKIIHIRYDLRYMEEVRFLRKELLNLLRLPLEEISPQLLGRAKSLQKDAQTHLDILKTEAFHRKAMARWQLWLPVFTWEMESNQALLRTLELIASGARPERNSLLEDTLNKCFSFQAEAIQCLQGQDIGIYPTLCDKLPDEIYSSASSSHELEFVCTVVKHYAILQAYPTNILQNHTQCAPIPETE